MDAVSKLREMGASEDDILGSVLDVHPEHKAAAEQLIQAGASPKDVVDSISDVVTDKQRSRAANQSWGEWGLDLGRGLVHGAGEALSAIGQTASRPDASNLSKSIGNAAQTAGDYATALAGPDYQPSEARISDPRTYWDAPKAIAEAAPGLAGYMGAAAAGARAGGAAGLLGGPLAEVTVPVGTVLGGAGGAALYALYQHWGTEAAKHAEDAGRSKPTQEDFNKALPTALTQAGIDGAAAPIGGFAGKAGGAIGSLIDGGAGKFIGGAVKGSGLASTAGQIAGRTVATDAALAGSAAADQAVSDIGRGKSVDVGEALDAADKAAVVGTGLRAARGVGQVSGAMRFRDAPDPEALGRVADHLSSDRFPGNVQDPSQLRQNVAMGRDLYNGRVAALADGNLDQATQETLGFLRKGAVLDKNQIKVLADALADRNDLLQAARDQNAMNYLAHKSSDGNAPSSPVDALMTGAGKIVGDKVAHYGVGAAAAALGMSHPMALAAVGGAAAVSKQLGKVGAKVLGLDGQISNPLGYAAGRFNSAPDGGVVSTRRPAAHDEVLDAGPSPAGSPPPAARPMGYAPQPEAAPVPPAHPPLSEMIGPGIGPRFAPAAPQTQVRPSAPAEMAPMSEGSLIDNVMTQARAENRPYLDVLHEHHRSAASIASNKDVPPHVSEAARAEQSQIWKAIQVAEAQAHPDEVKRARSARTVQEIAPDAEMTIDATDTSPAQVRNPRQAPGALRQAMEAAMVAKAQEQREKAATKGVSERAQTVLSRPKKEAPAKAQTKTGAPTRAAAKTHKEHTSKVSKPATGSRPRTLKGARKKP